MGVALWVKSPFGVFREVVANLGIQADGPSPSDLGKDAAELAEFLRSAGFTDVVKSWKASLTESLNLPLILNS